MKEKASLLSSEVTFWLLIYKLRGDSYHFNNSKQLKKDLIFTAQAEPVPGAPSAALWSFLLDLQPGITIPFHSFLTASVTFTLNLGL